VARQGVGLAVQHRLVRLREVRMYKQVLDPVANSLGVSSIFAALGLLVLFVLLGGLRWKAHWAALVSLAVALVVAIVVYGMPTGQAFDAAAEGAAFGFFRSCGSSSTRSGSTT